MSDDCTNYSTILWQSLLPIVGTLACYTGFMYTKEQLMEAISNEIRIIKHLAEKIPADTEGYKPTENQRTTLELLQYLSMIFATATKAIISNDMSLFKTATEQATHTTLANFAAVMDEQDAAFRAALSACTDEQLAEKMNLFNQGEKPKGVYLTESLLKWTAAYKMQLFLYIKSSGNTSLSTPNLWAGMDMPA